MCLSAARLLIVCFYAITFLCTIVFVCLFFDTYGEYKNVLLAATHDQYLVDLHCSVDRELDGNSIKQARCQEWRNNIENSRNTMRMAFVRVDKKWGICMGIPCVEYFGTKASNVVYHMIGLLCAGGFFIFSLYFLIRSLSNCLRRHDERYVSFHGDEYSIPTRRIHYPHRPLQITELYNSNERLSLGYKED